MKIIYSILILSLAVILQSASGEETEAGKEEKQVQTEKPHKDRRFEKKVVSDLDKKIPKEVKDPPKAKKPDIIYLDTDKKVKIDLKNKTLEIPAEARLKGGIIELALGSLYTPNCRTHESAFLTDIKPSLIHAGLKAIGLNEGKPVEFNGQSAFPEGDGVYVFVRWKDEKSGKVILKRLEQLIYNRLIEKEVIDIQWAFTGSRFVKTKDGKDIYLSDHEGTVISTWHCVSTVIDIPLPEGDDDTVFFAHKKNMPAPKTRVTFIFSPFDITKKKGKAASPENPLKTGKNTGLNVKESKEKKSGLDK